MEESTNPEVLAKQEQIRDLEAKIEEMTGEKLVLTKIKIPIMGRSHSTGDAWIDSGDTLYPDDFQVTVFTLVAADWHELYKGSAGIFAEGVKLVPGNYYLMVEAPGWFEENGYHWLNIEPDKVPFSVPKVAGGSELTVLLQVVQ